jgi:hypothetical protein
MTILHVIDRSGYQAGTGTESATRYGQNYTVLPGGIVPVFQDISELIGDRIKFQIEVFEGSRLVQVHVQEMQIAAMILMREAVRNCRQGDAVRLECCLQGNEIQLTVQSASDALNELVLAVRNHPFDESHTRAMLTPELVWVSDLAEAIGGSFGLYIREEEGAAIVAQYVLDLPLASGHREQLAS